MRAHKVFSPVLTLGFSLLFWGLVFAALAGCAASVGPPPTAPDKTDPAAVVVEDDAGEYRAEIQIDALAPLSGAGPDGAQGYAAPARIVSRDGARAGWTAYIVTDQQCARGFGRLVWVTRDGGVAGIAPWHEGSGTWPARVAAVLCPRVPLPAGVGA